MRTIDRIEVLINKLHMLGELTNPTVAQRTLYDRYLKEYSSLSSARAEKDTQDHCNGCEFFDGIGCASEGLGCTRDGRQ